MQVFIYFFQNNCFAKLLRGKITDIFFKIQSQTVTVIELKGLVWLCYKHVLGKKDMI